MRTKGKIDKKIFDFVVNICQFIRLALVILSFFIVIYWILEIANVAVEPTISSFFVSIKNFIHTFYMRTVDIEDQRLDFSYLLAVGINLLIAWILKVVVEYIREFERKYYKVKLAIKKTNEKTFNVDLHNDYVQEEYKNNKILMLLKFKVEQIKKTNLFGEQDASEDVKAEIIEGVINNFNKKIQHHLPCQIAITDDNIFIYFNDFNRIDDVLIRLESIFGEIRKEYIEQKWMIHSILGVDAYERSQEIPTKSEMLKKLVGIFYESKIVCSATFKQRYLLLSSTKYRFETQGVYQLEDVKEIFTLRRQGNVT